MKKHALYAENVDITFVIKEWTNDYDVNFLSLEEMYFGNDAAMKRYTLNNDRTAIFSTLDKIYKGIPYALRPITSYREINQERADDGFPEGEYTEPQFFVDFNGSYSPTSTIQGTVDKKRSYFPNSDISIVYDMLMNADGTLRRIVPLCLFHGKHKPGPTEYSMGLEYHKNLTSIEEETTLDINEPLKQNNKQDTSPSKKEDAAKKLSYYYDSTQDLTFCVEQTISKVNKKVLSGEVIGLKLGKSNGKTRRENFNLVVTVDNNNEKNAVFVDEFFTDIPAARISFAIRKITDLENGALLSYRVLGFIPMPKGKHTIKADRTQLKMDYPAQKQFQDAPKYDVTTSKDSEKKPKASNKVNPNVVTNGNRITEKALFFCPEDDITVIMEFVKDKDTGDAVKTSATGFFFGECSGKASDFSYGRKANYVNLETKTRTKPTNLEHKKYLIRHNGGDINFVMSEVTDRLTGDLVTLELTGFFYGSPEEVDDTLDYGHEIIY